MPDNLNNTSNLLMSLEKFIEKITQDEPVSFDETMTIIAAYYHYQPTEFSNGLNDDTLINEAGTNEGSCKIFAVAKLHQLDQQQTLSLFGDYYRLDVLPNPHGTGHQNIRNFMESGWEGIQFKGEALTPKSIS
jgi:HopJ type III effector protein